LLLHVELFLVGLFAHREISCLTF